jgi:type II secretory pathway component GspD/PulD (secretin)
MHSFIKNITLLDTSLVNMEVSLFMITVRKLGTVILNALIILLIIPNTLAKNFILEEPQTNKYIVKLGDNISTIANNKGVTPEELIIYNKLNTAKDLQPGQIIYFPVKKINSILQKTDADNPINANDFALFANDKTSSKNTVSKTTIIDQQATSQQKKLAKKEAVVYQVESTVEQDVLLPKELQPVMDPSNSFRSITKTKNETASKTQPTKELIEIEKPYVEPKINNSSKKLYAVNGSNEALHSVLTDFATNYNIPITIDIETNSTINGLISADTPEGFLDKLASVYNFLWYYDGHTLYIYDNNSVDKQLITLNYLKPNKLRKTLKQMDIWSDKFYWKEQEDDNLVIVSGYKRYVAMVRGTAIILDTKEGEMQKSKLEVRSFPLKYAWATDRTFNFRGQQLTVPGVSTILKQIIEGGGVAQAAETIVENKSLKPVAKYGQSTKNKANNSAEADQLNSGTDAETVYINADPRLNAIIVHDLGSKMPMYEQIIQSLDKPSKQIEISISIIDINTENLNSLGVQWSNSKDASNTTTIGSEATSMKTAYAVISSTIGEFNAKINALSGEGKVKVVAKPSIITLDNLESIIDNSSTYYVQVTSERTAELYPVTSGTILRVTPHIITEDTAKNKIHLSVNIEDGTGKAEGSSLPTTTNSTISTQAVVYEQESLLIGGFYKEREEKVSAKVPLLGDFPVLGYLFKSTKKHKTKTVRLFLITPLIVSS